MFLLFMDNDVLTDSVIFLHTPLPAQAGSERSVGLTRAMSAQAFLWILCCSTRALSSSSVQAPFWISGRSS